MADISITASAVVPSTAALNRRRRAIAGATIAAGEEIYLDTAASNVAKLADANGASALIRTAVGMAINSASSGQPVEYITDDDDLTIGTHGVTVNGAIVGSATPGKLAPIADNTTGRYGRICGIAKTSTKIVYDATGLATGVATA